MTGQKDRTTNPTRYGKPKRPPVEKDARSVALGRSLVIRMCPEWENQLDEMNRSKRGRPFAYPDLLMGGIAYIRYVLGEGLRVTEGLVDAMLGRGAKGPDHVTIWRRTCAQAVSIDGNRITIKTTDGKTHALVADSTGITTTGKGKWIEIKWNVKCSFIKLHILADEGSQKILAFRITGTKGGDAENLPGMLDEALEGLGVPLEDHTMEPSVSVQVDDTPADESTLETITEYMCDCGCCRPVARERRVSRVKRPPAVIIRGDGGYDSHAVFSHCRKRGVRTTIRVRIDANCRADGVDRARPEAVLEQLGGGCTAARFAKMGKDERKKHQKEWKERVRYNSRWMVEIIISTFKRLLGEALRAVKPEYVMIEMATKIAVYNKTRDVMSGAVW